MKNEIHNYLKLAKSPVKRSVLLSHLLTLGYEITDRKLRSTVEEMIKESGYCIESSESGYALIMSQEQLERAMAYLSSKAESIAVRKNYLLKNFNAMQEAKNEPLLKGEQFLMFP